MPAQPDVLGLVWIIGSSSSVQCQPGFVDEIVFLIIPSFNILDHLYRIPRFVMFMRFLHAIPMPDSNNMINNVSKAKMASLDHDLSASVVVASCVTGRYQYLSEYRF